MTSWLYIHPPHSPYSRPETWPGQARKIYHHTTCLSTSQVPPFCHSQGTLPSMIQHVRGILPVVIGWPAIHPANAPVDNTERKQESAEQPQGSGWQSCGEGKYSMYAENPSKSEFGWRLLRVSKLRWLTRTKSSTRYFKMKEECKDDQAKSVQCNY